MNTKFTISEKTKLREVMSMIGKLSHKKSPRSKEMMKEIGEKGRKVRWEKYRSVREARSCGNCKTISEHKTKCVPLQVKTKI